MSKDAYYFSHDSNARRQRKIIKMLSKYPYGYQWYFMTLEMLREETGYKYPLKDIDSLALELREPYDRITTWLQDCISVFELFTKDKQFFWSQSLIDRMKKMEHRREQNRENIKKRWERHESDTTVLPSYNESDTTVLQKKGKEIKKKEIKKKLRSKTQLPENHGNGIEIPENLNNPSFQSAWSDWNQYRREIRKPLKPMSMKQQLKFLAEQPDPVACINQSITNQWQGLFEIKHLNNGNGHYKPEQHSRQRVLDNVRAVEELIANVSKRN